MSACKQTAIKPFYIPGWKGARDCARRAPAPRYFAVIRAIAP